MGLAAAFRDEPAGRLFTADDLVVFWRRAFLSPEEQLDGTFAARRRVGWRLVREIARLRGMLRGNEFLADATSTDPGWTEPWQVFPTKHVDVRDPLVIGISRQPIALLPTASDSPPSGEVVEQFCAIADTVGKRLGLRARAEDDTAFVLLTDPSLALLSWPMPSDFTDFENIEAARVLRLLLARTELDARATLTQEGYGEAEATTLIGLAKRSAKRLTMSDPEADKGLMMMRLQEALERARDDGKVPAEAALLRLMASIQGLISSGDQQDEDVAEMVRSVKRASIAPAPERLLLEPPVEPAP
jgi:hypothetical protein